MLDENYSNSKELELHAKMVRDALERWKNATPKTAGVIIDLREHKGGDIYPFLVGLSPLFKPNVITNVPKRKAIDWIKKNI